MLRRKFAMLPGKDCRMVLTFETVDEIDRSNECYQAVLSCGLVYGTVNEILNI